MLPIQAGIDHGHDLPFAESRAPGLGSANLREAPQIGKALPPTPFGLKKGIIERHGLIEVDAKVGNRIFNMRVG